MTKKEECIVIGEHSHMIKISTNTDMIVLEFIKISA